MSELYGASETSVVKVIAGSEAIVFNNQVCYLQTACYSDHPRPMNYEQAQTKNSEFCTKVIRICKSWI